jgi:hypothetical protein
MPMLATFKSKESITLYIIYDLLQQHLGIDWIYGFYFLQSFDVPATEIPAPSTDDFTTREVPETSEYKQSCHRRPRFLASVSYNSNAM